MNLCIQGSRFSWSPAAGRTTQRSAFSRAAPKSTFSSDMTEAGVGRRNGGKGNAATSLWERERMATPWQ